MPYESKVQSLLNIETKNKDLLYLTKPVFEFKYEYAYYSELENRRSVPFATCDMCCNSSTSYLIE